MGDGTEEAKKIKEIVFKNIKRILFPIILMIAIGLVALSACMYFLTIDDGTYKEGDWSSVPYGAEQYINAISANREGILENNITAKELWDEMLKNKSRVDKYLDTPEELARLMKAEIVTQYPDTRPDPDQEIDWDSIVENPDMLQGIIKFKRADSENNKSTMIYTDPETFQGYIDEYNSTGSETAKQNALSHFTLKKSAVTVNKNQTNKELDKDEEDQKKDKKEKDKNKEEEKKETRQPATIAEVAGDGYSQEYTSSSGITYKHYKQGKGAGGSYAGNSYWDGTISSSGCGPTSVAILASGLTDLNYNPGDIAQEMDSKDGTSYDTLQKEMDSLGMISQVVQSPSAETILDCLRNGKVMLVSVNSATRFTNNRHIMAIVDINSNGQVYICNPSGSGEGWYDISTITNGCNYIVVTDAGATGIAPATGSGNSDNATNHTSNRSGYTAVVATWRQVDTKITTDDPKIESTSETEYSMTSTNINYEAMVEKFTMPFDLLWALLVVGEDKNFVFELADLVYHSDIEITVHDSLKENTDTDEWHYTEKRKAVVNADITAKCGDNTETGKISNDIHDPDEENSYTTTKTVITKTNTLNIELTKANVWIVDYHVDFTYSAPSENTTTSTVTRNDQSDPDSPSSTDDSYSCKHISQKKEELKKKVVVQTSDSDSTNSGDSSKDVSSTSDNNQKTDTSNKVTYNETVHVDYYTKYVNISDDITNKTKLQMYIKGSPEIKEKTDKKAKEPNFVTLYKDSKYLDNKNKIEDVNEWLLEIMESNDSTKNMVDLMKYLLYKATGSDYGVKEYKFAEYNPNSFTTIDGEYGDWNGTGDKLAFIETVAPYAVIDMEQHQIYASVTIAQAIVESGWGKNSIAIQYKNFFGMKAFGTTGNEFWSGQSVALHASEGGISRFRVYDSLKNSVYDHGRNFHVTKTYAAHGVLDCVPQNLGPQEQAKRIALSGYAVNLDGSIAKPDGKRTYDQYLYEGLIKPYNLEQYDTMSASDFKEEGKTEIVEIAKTKLGCQYVYGTAGPDTFDCSGFVQWVYGQYGIALPRSTGDYRPYLGSDKEISWDEAKPGDIVWKNGHMGIYLGNDQYIHAPQTGDVVKIAQGAKGKFTNVFRFSK